MKVPAQDSTLQRITKWNQMCNLFIYFLIPGLDV